MSPAPYQPMASTTKNCSVPRVERITCSTLPRSSARPATTSWFAICAWTSVLSAVTKLSSFESASNFSWIWKAPTIVEMRGIAKRKSIGSLRLKPTRTPDHASVRALDADSRIVPRKGR